MSHQYPYVEVSGTFESGLMILASLTPHLSPDQTKSVRSVILTPYQSDILWEKLKAIRGDKP